MSNQKTFSIYTLSCPKTGTVRYVGATSQTLPNRFWGHKTDAKRHNSSPVQRWVRSLMDEGLEPIPDIVDTCDVDTWQAKEKYWIQHYKDAGCDLTNSSDGGVHCTFDEQTRRKQSEAKIGENSVWYGKHHSEESRKKISDSQPHRRPIIQYTKDGYFVRQWGSATEASLTLSISHAVITLCCQRKPHRNTAGGYIWRYADDTLNNIKG